MLLKERTKVYDFNYHLVWTTKYRKHVFTNKELSSSMKDILTTIAKGNRVTIQNLEVMSDHVDMMISFPPNIAPSSIVKSFKGTSARQWFKKYPETKSQVWEGHLWSGNFFMSTVGNVSKEIVDQYINDQLTNYNAGRPRR